MQFKDFASAVRKQFNKMAEHQLFVVDIPGNTVYQEYLESFPKGTNNLYRTRGEYDCQCCRTFIKNIGNVVALIDFEVVTVWDVEVEGHYHDVAKALARLVKKTPIKEQFLTSETKIGVEKSFQLMPDGAVKTWNHFSCIVPSRFQSTDINAIRGDDASIKQVFLSGLNTLTVDALETTLDLINQGSLYRGEEFRHIVTTFLQLKKAYIQLQPLWEENYEVEEAKWIWQNISTFAVRIKNTAIGSLIQDLSSDIDLNEAVRKYEFIVAPSNYKRPKTLITENMVTQAMKTINELGIDLSLHRRYAELSDISVNNVLWADRSTAGVMRNSIKDILTAAVKPSIPVLDKLEAIDIETFLSSVLPTLTSIEVLPEYLHTPNFVSLVAPKYPEAKNILKWDNNFSWSYTNDVTDSIQERVKQAGGNAGGKLRVSLSWSNTDDLDLAVASPKSYISYVEKHGYCGGKLDVDANAGSLTRKPIENIAWEKNPPEGTYRVDVSQYRQREEADVGFTLEIAIEGKIEQFTYDKPVKGKLGDLITIQQKDGKLAIIKVSPLLTRGGKNTSVYGVDLGKFHKVSSIMLSPNFWDEQAIGNKHYFFILEGCKNPAPLRGLYNEFLSNELHDHKKVFEVLGSKLLCEPSESQCSGLGFSSTQRNYLICKVKGTFTRTLKIIF